MILAEQIGVISKSIGVNPDILKTVLSLILTLLLSPILRVLPSRPSRNVCAGAVGSIFLVFLLQEWALYVVVSALLPYLLITLMPRRRMLISVSCSCLFLLFIHLHRFIFDFKSWKVDCSVFVMYTCTKLTYFGLHEISKTALTNTHNYTFLDYLGYVFYFPSVIIGPTFSFQTYLDFVNRNEHYASIPLPKQVFTPLLYGAALILPTAYAISVFTPNWVNQNPFYLSLSLPLKILCSNLIGICYRLKFYTAWSLAQTAVNLSGISYNRSGQFDAVVAGDIRFELVANPKAKTEFWNSSIQTWLKLVVYEPIAKKTNNSGLALFLTFLVSAFWHGVYLTYYLGFAQWALLNHLCKWVYKWSVVLPKKIADSAWLRMITYIASATVLNYIGMFIVVLEWNDACKFYQGVMYWGTIILGFGLILTLVVQPPKRKEN